MIDLSRIQSTLKRWSSSLMDVPPAAVVMRNEPRPLVVGGLLVLLSWVSIVGLGADDVRLIVDDTVSPPFPNAVDATVTLRKMTLQIDVETFSQDPNVNGLLVLERLRSLLYGGRSVDILASANIGLIDMDQATQADYQVDDRWISRVVASVRFNQSDFTVDRDPAGARTTIESVDATDHLTGEDGDELRSTLEWDHHKIGPV